MQYNSQNPILLLKKDPFPDFSQSKDRYLEIFEYIKQKALNLPKNNAQNVHLKLKVYGLMDEDLISFGTQLFYYQSINEITVQFNQFDVDTYSEQQMKTFGFILRQIPDLNSLAINGLQNPISFNCFITFLKEVTLIQSLQNLKIQLCNNDLFQEAENFQIFASEIGNFIQIIDLKLDLSDMCIKASQFLIILYGITECLYLEKLDIKLKGTDFYACGLENLQDIIVKFYFLKELSLELDIIDIDDKHKQVLFDMISSLQNLIAISLKLNIYFSDQSDKEIIESVKPKYSKYLNIQHISIIIDDKNHQDIGISTIQQCNNLLSLNLDLTKCEQKQILNYGEVISFNQNLRKLNIKIDITNIYNVEFNQFGKQISSCIELQIVLIKQSRQSAIEITNISQLLAGTSNIQIFQIDFRGILLKTQYLNELLNGLSKCQQLQSLTIKAGLGFAQQIDAKYFIQSLSKNKYLTCLTFDFRIHPHKSPITLRTKEKEQQYMCGTYYMSLFRQQTECQNIKNNFIKNITNGYSFKKNSRLVKIDILFKRLIRYRLYGSEEAYDLSSDEDNY